MKRFVSLILSVCFLFSINTVSYAANISSRKASNPVIQSMNDKYHVDFSGMSIDELNKFIDKMKDEDQTRASGNLLNNTQLAWLAAAQIARDKGYEYRLPTSTDCDKRNSGYVLSRKYFSTRCKNEVIQNTIFMISRGK